MLDILNYNYEHEVFILEKQCGRVGLLSHQHGFTLAEVLITLGIIGVVSAITIPSLMKNWQDLQYKSAYKKAYSDMSQVFSQAIQEQTLTPRAQYDDIQATASEWAVLKNGLKVAKDCPPADLALCWAEGEKVFKNSFPNVTESSFIDSSGRAWAEFYLLQNIYLVDTNGFEKPNRYGKDRWVFQMKNADNSQVVTGLPNKIGSYISSDIKEKDTDWCQYPPCNYESWLYK